MARERSMNDSFLKESPAGGQIVMDGHTASINAAPSVGQLVAQRPQRARILEKWKLDYCCGGGNATLSQACRKLGVNPEIVEAELAAHDAAPLPGTSLACAAPQCSVSEAIDHLVSVHHAYLRQELPRMTRLADRIVDRHGELHPLFWELRELVDEFATAMETHLQHQSEVVLPVLKQVTKTPRFHAVLSDSMMSLRVLHNRYREMLGRLNHWTHGYTAPPGTCTTYRVLMESLADLDGEVQRYLREEELVFERAVGG